MPLVGHEFVFSYNTLLICPMFSLLISTTGKRVFQTGQALASGMAYCAQCITWNKQLPHILIRFMQIVLPLLVYELKDQSFVEQAYIKF